MPADQRLNVVLFEPEIPQNAGNIMRTCVAAGFYLHLIKPLGFDIDNPRFKRATTNHITWADYTLYEDFDDFSAINDGEYFFMTRYGKRAPSDIDFRAVPGERKIYLIFGKESTGIPLDILKRNSDRCFRIPMTAECRSLNLSNAAAIAVYECLRQLGYPGLSFEEVQKGADYLESYDATLGRFE